MNRTAKSQPPLPFVNPKTDDDITVDEVEVKWKIDESVDSSDKMNYETKTFNVIESFTHNGPVVVETLRALELDLMGPYGLKGKEKLEKRIQLYQRVLKGNARTQFDEVVRDAKVAMLDTYDVKESNKLKNSKAFYQWLKEDDNLPDEVKSLTPDEIQDWKDNEESFVSGEQHCQAFERRIWFDLGKKMWRNHRNVHDDHLHYLMTDIVKPYKMSMIDFVERLRTLFDMKRYLQPPSMRNETSEEANWDARDLASTEITIRKAIRDGLHDSLQIELDQKEEDYRMVNDEKFNEYLVSIEHSELRRRDERTRANERLKKTKSDDSTSTPIPKRKKTPRSSSSFSSRSEAVYCQLCKNAGMPAKKYASHHTKDCQDADLMKSKAGGSVGDRNEANRMFKRAAKSYRKELKTLKRKHQKLQAFADKHKQEFRRFELKRASKKGKKKSSRVIEIPSSSSESDSSSDSDSDISDDSST